MILPEIIDLENTRQQLKSEIGLRPLGRSMLSVFVVFVMMIVALPASAERSDLDHHSARDNRGTLACEVEPKLQALLNLHNTSRIEGGKCSKGKVRSALKLQWNCSLAAASKRHATDMFEQNIGGHTGSDGSTMGTRVVDEGYIWSSIGENIAQGFDTSESVYQAWLASPGHCKNIRNRDYQDIGAAEVGGNWVVVFGRAKTE